MASILERKKKMDMGMKAGRAEFPVGGLRVSGLEGWGCVVFSLALGHGQGRAPARAAGAISDCGHGFGHTAQGILGDCALRSTAGGAAVRRVASLLLKANRKNTVMTGNLSSPRSLSCPEGAKASAHPAFEGASSPTCM